MSKKNNKKKSKEYTEFLARSEKEKIQRSEKKKERKILLNIEANISNSFSTLGFSHEMNSNLNNQCTGMDVSTYKRPKKATRVRKRHREYIMKSKSHKNISK